MKVIGINGKEYSLLLKKKNQKGGSSFHCKARILLSQLFPHESVYEEVVLPGSGKLAADFLLPRKRLVVEVHGRQHYEYVPHFHGDELNFLSSIHRDDRKRQWCEINQFLYVELPYDSDQWEREIRRSLGHSV